MEIWKDVVGYRGYYQVSDLGQVRSVDHVVRMVDGRNYRMKGRILKERQDGKYRQVALCNESSIRYPLVHRLVLQAFVGPCPKGMECRHLDGNRSNNSLYNLCWGTKEENGQDKINHGHSLRGPKNSNTRLTESQVRRIRNLWSTGDYRQRDLGFMFRVDRTTVTQIVNRRTWKYL